MKEELRYSFNNSIHWHGMAMVRSKVKFRGLRSEAAKATRESAGKNETEEHIKKGK